MKYLIINGSPRKKNTWKIVQQAAKNLEGEFEEVQLYVEDIPMCRGCFNFFFEDETYCPHFEKINPIVEKIKACDGLIITSPVYAMNITAILKNFFDHTAYFYHRPQFFDKKALVIVSTAGAGEKGVAKYIDETMRHWGFNKVYKIVHKCGGKEYLETEGIDKISKKFNEDVKSEKLHSPKLIDIVYFNVWKAMATSQNPIKADHEYWMKTGLVNYDYSPIIKLNFIKKTFSKLIYFIMKRFIK